MREQTPQFILISAELGKFSIEGNSERTAKLQKYLEDKKVNYKRVLGRYKYENGEHLSEVSFLIPDRSDTNRLIIWDIMRDFSQESFLYVNEHRQAFLQFSNGKRQNLGRFVETTYIKAQNSEAYTYDLNTKKYYICA